LSLQSPITFYLLAELVPEPVAASSVASGQPYPVEEQTSAAVAAEPSASSSVSCLQSYPHPVELVASVDEASSYHRGEDHHPD